MGEEPILPVIIADDGELDDLRRLLDELDIQFVEAWRREAQRSILRISTPRYAFGSDAGDAECTGVSCRFHIIISEEVSRTLQKELRRGLCDFVLQSPVDPAVLRLLVVHALYGGPEKRRGERVAMSAVVTLRTGLRSRMATLVQLSLHGCGLTSRHAFTCRDRLTVDFPRELAPASGLSLEARVVAVDPAGGEAPHKHNFSVVFRPPDAKTRRLLLAVMAKHAIGSAAIRPRRAKLGASRAATKPPTRGSSAKSDQERGPTQAAASKRPSSRRKSYRGLVLAAGQGAAHVVIGRDLSTGGMRVAPDSSLCVGDEFKLTIHGRAGHKPMLVKAIVARDDGDAGCVLHFRDLSPRAAAKLERIVESLPSFPSSDACPNVVVSEIAEER